MGVDASATTAIGILLSKDQVVENKKQRLKGNECCQEYDTNFCPKCGEEIFEEVETFKDFVQERRRYDCIEGYKLLPSDSGYVDSAFILCCFHSEAGGYGEKTCSFSPPLDIQAEKEKMEALTEPLGLWDEEKFGIYTVLYWS